MPSKIAPMPEVSRPPTNPQFLRHTRVHSPNGISIGYAVLAHTAHGSDQQRKQTDHATAASTGHVHCSLKTQLEVDGKPCGVRIMSLADHTSHCACTYTQTPAKHISTRTHARTHTRLTALVHDYTGELVPER